MPYRPLTPDPGKSVAAVTESAPPTYVYSGGDDSLIVHSDNLHALKALLPRYAGGREQLDRREAGIGYRATKVNTSEMSARGTRERRAWLLRMAILRPCRR